MRLAIVAKDAADLAAKLERIQVRASPTLPASEFTARPASTTGHRGMRGSWPSFSPASLFLGWPAAIPRGSAELYLHFPEIRRRSRSGGCSSAATIPIYSLFSYQLFPPKLLDAKTLQKIELELAWSERSPMGISMANLANWHLLHSLGIEPDMLAGFSLGELSSLFASEVIDPGLDLDTLKPWGRSIYESNSAVRRRHHWMRSGQWWPPPPNGPKSILRGIPGNVSVTIDVSPSQVFIGGEIAAVRGGAREIQGPGNLGAGAASLSAVDALSDVHTERAAPMEAMIREIGQTRFRSGPANTLCIPEPPLRPTRMIRMAFVR